MQDSDSLGSYQRSLFRRLRRHRIARDERRGNLAGEDRERKIPRTDADDWTERAIFRPQCLAGLFRVVAQEVDRFTYLGHCIRHRLSGLAGDETEEGWQTFLHEIGGAQQA